MASEDLLTCGVASEIAAIVAEEALWYLDAPIRRVSVPDTPIPFAPALEQAVLPQASRSSRRCARSWQGRQAAGGARARVIGARGERRAGSSTSTASW